jgi:hypothetical protein
MEYCKDCQNVTPRARGMWYCTKHKKCITEYTLASVVMECKGKDFKKVSNKGKAMKEKGKQNA